MEFTVKGTANQDADCVLNILPQNSGTIITGAHPNQTIYQPSTDFKKVGVFPCVGKFTILFNVRPWKVEVQQRGGTYFSTTNEAQGLANKVILTPDVVNINLKFEL